MQQAWTGPPAEAPELVTAFTKIGIVAIGFSVDALGRMTLFVPSEHAREAAKLIAAIELLDVVSARRRVSDASMFRGGRGIGGVA
ncbi:MAG: hypothetical protein ACREM1_06695 [Longimicrobiales bacterium]